MKYVKSEAKFGCFRVISFRHDFKIADALQNNWWVRALQNLFQTFRRFYFSGLNASKSTNDELKIAWTTVCDLNSLAKVTFSF